LQRCRPRACLVKDRPMDGNNRSNCQELENREVHFYFDGHFRRGKFKSEPLGNSDLQRNLLRSLNLRVANHDSLSREKLRETGASFLPAQQCYTRVAVSFARRPSFSFGCPTCRFCVCTLWFFVCRRYDAAFVSGGSFRPVPFAFSCLERGLYASVQVKQRVFLGLSALTRLRVNGLEVRAIQGMLRALLFLNFVQNAHSLPVFSSSAGRVAFLFRQIP
jgi:hypothetical protein